MRITAVCIFGIESILAGEIRRLGYKILETTNGRITFEGDITAVAKANLWLRTAERVYIELSVFKAFSFDELYEGIKIINWKEYIPETGRFPVGAASINSKLFSTHDCQTISKKAIADKLGEQYELAWMPEKNAEYPIELFIHNNNVHVYIDTTGTGLHKRGYRKLNVEAPLKETIAAALLLLSYWRPGRILMDPFCGSGTFPIEAAMIASNTPPGLNREYVFNKWSGKNREILNQLKEDAKKNIKREDGIQIFGSDISGNSIEIAKIHAKNADMHKYISFKTCDVSDVEKPGEYGVAICNPPYGQRMSDKESIKEIYLKFCEKLKTFKTWSSYILTDMIEFEKICGQKADKRRKIYNGTIRCTFFQYFGPKPPISHE